MNVVPFDQFAEGEDEFDDFNLGEMSDHEVALRAAIRLVDDLEVTAVARAVGVLAA